MRVSARELVSSAQSSKQPMAVLAGLVTQEQRRLVRWRTFLLLTQTLGRLSVKAGQFSEQSTVEITGLGKQAGRPIGSWVSLLQMRITGRLLVFLVQSSEQPMEGTTGSRNQAEQRMISGTSRLPTRIMGRLLVTRARSFVL